MTPRARALAKAAAERSAGLSQFTARSTSASTRLRAGRAGAASTSEVRGPGLGGAAAGVAVVGSSDSAGAGAAPTDVAGRRAAGFRAVGRGGARGVSVGGSARGRGLAHGGAGGSSRCTSVAGASLEGTAADKNFVDDCEVPEAPDEAVVPQPAAFSVIRARRASEALVQLSEALSGVTSDGGRNGRVDEANAATAAITAAAQPQLLRQTSELAAIVAEAAAAAMAAASAPVTPQPGGFSDALLSPAAASQAEGWQEDTESQQLEDVLQRVYEKITVCTSSVLEQKVAAEGGTAAGAVFAAGSLEGDRVAPAGGRQHARPFAGRA
mmetsp:Transcript_126681/g.404934  ORF Transcript_126681/g.404934 Transcript_126681/m.404934 type:complete len:325 (-) Transcript_126681:747-1721(-)